MNHPAAFDSHGCCSFIDTPEIEVCGVQAVAVSCSSI